MAQQLIGSDCSELFGYNAVQLLSQYQGLPGITSVIFCFASDEFIELLIVMNCLCTSGICLSLCLPQGQCVLLSCWLLSLWPRLVLPGGNLHPENQQRINNLLSQAWGLPSPPKLIILAKWCNCVTCKSKFYTFVVLSLYSESYILKDQCVDANGGNWLKSTLTCSGTDIRFL